MSSINKIHVNGATTLSLNDRFTIMQKAGNKVPASASPSAIGLVRRRSRSRSRSRSNPQPVQHHPVARVATLRNQSLLARFEQKHKFRAALKLKRRSLNTNFGAIGARKRLMNRVSAQGATTVAAISNLRNGAHVPRRRVRRSNSVARRIATMQADLINANNGRRKINRSNATVSITERLGLPRRPILKRSQSRQRSASATRINLRQNQPLRRTNSKTNLRSRSTSRQRLNGRLNGRLNSRSDSRSNSRSNSRPNIRQNIRPNNRANIRPQLNQQRQQPQQGRKRIIRTRSQSRSGKKSVNARLGIRRDANGGIIRRDANGGIVRRDANGGIVRRGRIVKRRNPNARNNVANGGGGGGGGGKQAARGRSRSRTQQQGGARNRSRSRSRVNNQQARGRQSRGRSRSRGRGRQGKPTTSKEELDKELDQFMGTQTGLGH